MKIVVDSIKTPTTYPFSFKKETPSPSRLVAHWLHDSEGKLYRVWVREAINR